MSKCDFQTANNIPHGPNEISTSVALPKGTDYALFWRSSSGTTHTALCEIFVPHQGRYWRVGTHFMDKDKPATQCRLSSGRLSPLFDYNGWLKSPSPFKKRFVALEVRRGTGTPAVDLSDGDEISIDLIDDPDEEPSHPLFIVFRFDFVGTALNSTPGKRRFFQLHRQVVNEFNSGSMLTISVPQKRKSASAPDSGHKTGPRPRPTSAREQRRSTSPLSESSHPDEDKSVLDLVRDALAAEEKIDAELREQKIRAADAEEVQIDGKLREQLLATKKWLEMKGKKQRAANMEQEKADLDRKESFTAFRSTEKRIREKKKLLG
ncbi:hypothetical protein C8R44DRAFT_922711 [Mycena epipterygia]|nr:hypothetical protein C8R44DRAFT_922711 [Mycena epipterygia]